MESPLECDGGDTFGQLIPHLYTSLSLDKTNHPSTFILDYLEW